MFRYVSLVAVIVLSGFAGAPAGAAVTVFFDPSQTATLVDSGVTSDTISSSGYLFFCTRDKLFTGGTGEPIGRSLRVDWPEGVEAQAVTTPPPGVTDHKARMTLQRVDGAVFDLTSFTVKILASTSGAGAALEIMPLVNGEDAFADPIAFDVTGYYGQTFSYDTSPNPFGSTALLVGYDTYKLALYVDFALVALTLQSADTTGDLNCDGVVDLFDIDPFVMALTSAADTPPFAGYYAAYPGCDPLLADIDANGVVNLFDIDPFVALLTAP